MSTDLQMFDKETPPNLLEDRLRAVFTNSGLVVFPTETVYGIGASITSKRGVANLRAFKSREDLTPFTLHLGEVKQVGSLIDPADSFLRLAIEKLMPAPVTCIVDVPHQAMVANVERLGLPASAREIIYHRGTVGLRCPAHGLARKILNAGDGLVVASSANLKGQPAPRNMEQALAATGSRGQAYVDGGQTQQQQASTIIKVSHAAQRMALEVLRPGIWDERIIREKMMYRILFVCTGNTCRSPMAEAIAQDYLAKQKGLQREDLPSAGITVTSAGVFASDGQQASSQAVEALRGMDIDLSAHQSSALTGQMVEAADKIYCMTRSHQATILQHFPQAAQKMEMIRVDESDVPDPFGSSLEQYMKCADVIQQNITQRLARKRYENQHWCRPSRRRCIRSCRI